MSRHHLLHIDASIQAERSISRRLTARAVARWRERNPEGTVTYRDLGSAPPPHLDHDGAMARVVPPEQHTPEQAAAFALSRELADEIREADTVLLGLPLYNYGAPSAVKAWVDHLIAPGVTFDPASGEGWLGGREFIVLASRGGGYGPGAPREGWDHAEPWLPHGLSLTGLQPTRIIAAELTLADVTPQMADLRELAAESLRAAERAIDELWSDVAAEPQAA